MKVLRELTLEKDWLIVELRGAKRLRHMCGWRVTDENTLPPAGNSCGPTTLICRWDKPSESFVCNVCQEIVPKQIHDLALLGGVSTLWTRPW